MPNIYSTVKVLLLNKIMKTSIRIIIVSLLLTVLQACSNDDHALHNHETHEGEEQTYTCSMHPQVVEHAPGLCPICKMELTPVKKSNSAANFDIELSEEQIQLGHITTQTIGLSSQTETNGYNATLTYKEESIKTVTARAMGRIEKLHFKTSGEYVKKGQPVYDLYSEEIAITKQDFINASKGKSLGKNAELLLKNAKQKLLFYGLTEKQIAAIPSNNDVSPITTFYSDYEGYTTDILITEGNYVMEGSEILKLAGLNSLWTEVQVYANQANSIRMGQEAIINFPEFPEFNSKAHVTFINPEINPDTRLLLVRLSIPNPTGELKPGMQALVNFNSTAIEGLFIPSEAIVRTEHGNYIWHEVEKGKFKTQMVETGVETNGLIEIKKGLKQDEKIVVTGTYLLNSEYVFRKGSDPMAGHNM